MALQNCGEMFRRRYIEKEYSQPNARMIRGTVVHKVASRAYFRKLQAQGLPSIEETKDTAASEFDLAWRRGVVLSEEEAQQGITAVRDGSKDFAVDLSAFHIATVAPAVEPIGVERKITVKPKDSDLVIHGIIDLIDKTATGEQIRDLKTSEKSPFVDAAEKSQQLSMYGLIRLAEVGSIPERFTLDTLVRTPVKAEKKHVQQHTVRDGADMRALVNRINTAVEAVKKGLFVPADPSHWLCSKTYCNFWDSCPYTRRSDRPKS
jgi:RecB family exonuclease